MKRTNKESDEERGELFSLNFFAFKSCCCLSNVHKRKIIIFSLKPNQGSEKEPHNLLTIGLFIKIYVRLSSKLVYL